VTGVSPSPLAHRVGTNLEGGGDAGDAQSLSGRENDAGALDQAMGCGKLPADPFQFGFLLGGEDHPRRHLAVLSGGGLALRGVGRSGPGFKVRFRRGGRPVEG